MTVLLVANEEQKGEWLSCPADNTIRVTWITKPEDLLTIEPFEACIDLLFENTRERISWLRNLNSPLILVNSVIEPMHQIQQPFVRINGWNTFLKRAVMEAAPADAPLREKAERLITRFGRRTEWVADIPGFITPRVVASIINEAFFALQENVSTRDDIDIAMKLGTNYPFGPFEWGEKIGLGNIYALLDALGKKQNRYQPASLLKQTALA
jgi:3-hydroxybutyryl-CoA dehydrogenase